MVSAVRFAGKLYKGLGNEVTELFCEVDGNFPNHHPDPSKPKTCKTSLSSSKTAMPKSAWHLTAMPTAWAWSPKTATSSIQTAN